MKHPVDPPSYESVVLSPLSPAPVPSPSPSPSWSSPQESPTSPLGEEYKHRFGGERTLVSRGVSTLVAMATNPPAPHAPYGSEPAYGSVPAVYTERDRGCSSQRNGCSSRERGCSSRGNCSSSSRCGRNRDRDRGPVLGPQRCGGANFCPMGCVIGAVGAVISRIEEKKAAKRIRQAEMGEKAREVEMWELKR